MPRPGVRPIAAIEELVVQIVEDADANLLAGRLPVVGEHGRQLRAELLVKLQRRVHTLGAGLTGVRGGLIASIGMVGTKIDRPLATSRRRIAPASAEYRQDGQEMWGSFPGSPSECD